MTHKNNSNYKKMYIFKTYNSFKNAKYRDRGIIFFGQKQQAYFKTYNI